MGIQENRVMGERGRSLVVLMVAAILFASCGNRMVPVASIETASVGYDTLLYNYAIIEGSRNKMNGNAGDALNYYQQALKVNPESAVAPYEMSGILFIRGEKGGALQYGKLAVENDPENIWYLNNLANIYLALNYIDSTIHILERIVNIHPDEEETLFNLAGLYMQSGQPEKGETILRDFRSKYGDGEEIIISILNALKEQEKLEETEELLQEVSEKFPQNTAYQGMLAELYRKTGRSVEAEAIYKALFVSDPDNTTLLFSYLDYLFEEGRYDELTERVNMFLINDSIEIGDKLNLLTGFASDTLFLKEYGENFVLSAMVLEAYYPGSRDVKVALASIYGLVGDEEREIEKLKEIIKLFPRDYPSRESLLFKLNERGSNEELYNLASTVARDFNVYPLPKLLLAYAANELGKYDEAISELKKIRILINENPDFMMQILLLEADIYYNRGLYEDAWKRYDEALQLNPQDALVLNNYAYFLAEQDAMLKKADRMVDKALTIEKNITYLDTKAWILYKQGKYRNAFRVMKEIMDAGTRDPEILEHYGYILFKTGKCDEAVEYWQKALKEDPTKVYLLDEIEKCIR